MPDIHIDCEAIAPAFWQHLVSTSTLDMLCQICAMGLAPEEILSNQLLLELLKEEAPAWVVTPMIDAQWRLVFSMGSLDNPHRSIYESIIEGAKQAASRKFMLPSGFALSRWVFHRLYSGMHEKGPFLSSAPVVPNTHTTLTYHLEGKTLQMRAGRMLLGTDDATVISSIRYPQGGWYDLWVPIHRYELLGIPSLHPKDNFAVPAGIPIRVYLRDNIHMWSVLGRLSHAVSEQTQKSLNAPLFWLLMLQAIAQETTRHSQMTFHGGTAVLLYLLERSVVDSEYGNISGFEDRTACRLASFPDIKDSAPDATVLHSFLKHIPYLERPLDCDNMESLLNYLAF